MIKLKNSAFVFIKTKRSAFYIKILKHVCVRNLEVKSVNIPLCNEIVEHHLFNGSNCYHTQIFVIP